MPRYVRHIFLIAVGIAGLAAAYVFLPEAAALAFYLLFALWVINVGLKAAIGFVSDTAFADLSFASTVFSGTKALGRFTDAAPSTVRPGPTYAILGAIFLAALWVFNLIVVSNLAYNQLQESPDRDGRTIIAGTSFFLGIISVGSVLYLVITGTL